MANVINSVYVSLLYLPLPYMLLLYPIRVTFEPCKGSKETFFFCFCFLNISALK